MNNPIKDLPRYISIFQSYLGKKIYVILALTILAGIAEGIGILMLLPLFQGLDSMPGDDSMNQNSQALNFVNQILLSMGLNDSVLVLLIFISITFLIKGILTFAALAFSSSLRGKFLRILKESMFSSVTNLDYNYFSTRDAGNFINIINEQVNRAMQSFYYLSLLGAQLLNSIIYLGLALFVAWRFGLMAIMSGVFLILIFKAINVYVRQISRNLAKENGHLSKILIQTLHGFKYLTSTNQIDKLQENIESSIQRLSTYQVQTGVAAALTNSIREPVAVFFIMIIVIIQMIFLEEPIGPMMVSIVLFHRGLGAVVMSQGNWQSSLEFIGSMELINTEFNTLKEHKEIIGQIEAKEFSKKIKLDNVHYKYNKDSEDVISGLSLNIPIKKSIAFVGESGAGKSTVADLLTLMLKPSRGSVIIDDLNGNKINQKTWRKQIGYVSQEAVIFDDTIANNICLWIGNPGNDKKLLENIKNAAIEANLDSVINSLPDGYNTIVGDRGVRLSGGQRQRLFIARELFRRPNFLILDEATSSLDSESEKAIQRSIDALKGKMTIVIIAHRLSTITNVDKIYVLNKGRVHEEGSFEELRSKEESLFSKLVKMQQL
jgi:ABC-type multidrug transport system fused ATPase/permease subunit